MNTAMELPTQTNAGLEKSTVDAPVPRISKLPVFASRLPVPGSRLPVPRKSSNSGATSVNSTISPRSNDASVTAKTIDNTAELRISKSKESLRKISYSNGSRIATGVSKVPSTPQVDLDVPVNGQGTEIMPRKTVSRLPSYSKLRSPSSVSSGAKPLRSINDTNQSEDIAVDNGSIIQKTQTKTTGCSPKPPPKSSVTPTRLKAPAKLSVGSSLSSPSRLPGSSLRSPSSGVTPELLSPKSPLSPHDNGTPRRPSGPINSSTTPISIKKTRLVTPATLKKTSPKPSLASPTVEVTSEDRRARSLASSQTLREQIAKAKAAKNSGASLSVMKGADAMDVVNADPFNQIRDDSPNAGILKARIKSARMDGKLNISSMELKEIPEVIYKMYDSTAETDEDIRWFESVDLSRLNASDNEFESIGDELVLQFGGLTTIDLRNNALTSLPSNMCDLVLLTSLNLSNNKLIGDCLIIVGNITTLTNLSLSKNGFSGPLPEVLFNLVDLEVLEIASCSITSIPSNINQLSRLRNLDISNNKLESIPSLHAIPLVELHASNNPLQGSLFGGNIHAMSNLQTLDVQNARLTCLADDELISLPALKNLFVSNNRLESLPLLKDATSIIKITVNANQLKNLPESIVTMTQLKFLDIASNEISAIDPRLGLLETLDVLKIDGNPTRERRLAGLNTDDLKRNLRNKIEPETKTTNNEEITPNNTRTEQPAPTSSTTVCKNGTLDLSEKKIETFSLSMIDMLDVDHVETALISRNNLRTIPEDLRIFSNLVVLDLSNNSLKGSDYITTKLSFPRMTKLLLFGNGMTSLDPILKCLELPQLLVLDVHLNRLTSMPQNLVGTYPMLLSFFARNNQITAIDVESVAGLQVLDLSDNAIESLPPALGTHSKLRDLRLDGNVFRVPRRQIIEKGTESILAWLGDRIPVEQEVMTESLISQDHKDSEVQDIMKHESTTSSEVIDADVVEGQDKERKEDPGVCIMTDPEPQVRVVSDAESEDITANKEIDQQSPNEHKLLPESEETNSAEQVIPQEQSEFDFLPGIEQVTAIEEARTLDADAEEDVVPEIDDGIQESSYVKDVTNGSIDDDLDVIHEKLDKLHLSKADDMVPNNVSSKSEVASSEDNVILPEPSIDEAHEVKDQLESEEHVEEETKVPEVVNAEREELNLMGTGDDSQVVLGATEHTNEHTTEAGGGVESVDIHTPSEQSKLQHDIKSSITGVSESDNLLDLAL